jgi:hypothetical protein
LVLPGSICLSVDRMLVVNLFQFSYTTTTFE